jgi:AraC family transcriptional regulator of adaptative response/methylated-DNA-[protein]-cysteine methyltransferase
MSIDDATAEDADRWQAVLARDGRWDGRFVYAVRSTKVFCRPSCPSRRPGRGQVRFFATPAAAAAEGFRPCRRCRPEAGAAPVPGLDAVAQTCQSIEGQEDGMPSLTALGRQAAVSPPHLQRTFKALTGISPRQYGDAVRLRRLKASLRDGEPVAQALYGAGYGSSSRLYERAPAQLGMTPASYAKGGRGANIVYVTAEVTGIDGLGRLLVAATARGICMTALGDADRELEDALYREYPRATIRRDEGALAGRLAQVLDLIAGTAPAASLPLDVRATAFTWQVFLALMRIPRGETRSYGEIAAELGAPGAARAVGRACGSNPVAVLIPCHRAVGADGTLHGYRWGLGRKQALLDRERG